MRIGPVTFLLLVPALWAVVRGAMLWPRAPAPAEREISWAPALRDKALAMPKRSETPKVRGPIRAALVTQPIRNKAARISVSASAVASIALRSATLSQGLPTARDKLPHSAIAIVPLGATKQSRASPFSMSVWMLARGASSPGLATAGQLGGSQAGVRARYALAAGVHLAARLSGPLRSRIGKEAAIGIDVRPLPSLPVTLMIERRIALDRGGRDAFGVGAFGGFDRALGSGLHLDGYAQAGVVGLKRRDGYVDGALRLERDLTKRVGIGAGLWGGAQPGVARLDIGPQLVVHTGRFRIGAEWRQRVVGDARPGSGPVLSLSADF